MRHLSELTPRTRVNATADLDTLRRTCDCAGEEECACDEENGGAAMQRKADGPKPAGGVPPIVREVTRGGGRALDAPLRAKFESRFGVDFGSVRIHTDDRAAQSARAVHASAYTLGRDVVFGAGEYDPGSERGARLLAHELTHVVQQGSGAASLAASPDKISTPGDEAEIEADRVADGMMEGWKDV